MRTKSWKYIPKINIAVMHANSLPEAEGVEYLDRFYKETLGDDATPQMYADLSNQFDIFGATPNSLAINNKNWALSKLLLRYGASPTSVENGASIVTNAMAALKNGGIDVFSEMLDRGGASFDSNFKFNLNYCFHDLIRANGQTVKGVEPLIKKIRSIAYDIDTDDTPKKAYSYLLHLLDSISNLSLEEFKLASEALGLPERVEKLIKSGARANPKIKYLPETFCLASKFDTPWLWDLSKEILHGSPDSFSKMEIFEAMGGLDYDTLSNNDIIGTEIGTDVDIKIYEDLRFGKIDSMRLFNANKDRRSLLKADTDSEMHSTIFPILFDDHVSSVQFFVSDLGGGQKKYYALYTDGALAEDTEIHKTFKLYEFGSREEMANAFTINKHGVSSPNLKPNDLLRNIKKYKSRTKLGKLVAKMSNRM